MSPRLKLLISVGLSFLAVFALSKWCAASKQDVVAVIEEYIAECPPPQSMHTKTEPHEDKQEYLEEVKAIRREWGKTMEPYARQLLIMWGYTAEILTEIVKENDEKLTNIYQQTMDKEEAKRKKILDEQNLDEVCRKLNFCLYTLEKMGDKGAQALATLLRDGRSGAWAAQSLGIMDQKVILLNHFRDKGASEATRINAALGLTTCFGETEPVAFLVDFLLQGDDSREAEIPWLDTIAAFALSSVPEEAIPQLLQALRQGRVPENALWHLSFLKGHGLDLQKSIRLRLPDKEEKESKWFYPKGVLPRDVEALFIYPTDSLPEKRIKEFLAKLKKREKEELMLLIEVGRRVKYKAVEKILALCEEAEIYNIKLASHSLELGFSASLAVRCLSTQLAKPVEKPGITSQTLFVGIEQVSSDKKRKEGIYAILRPWQYTERRKLTDRDGPKGPFEYRVSTWENLTYQKTMSKEFEIHKKDVELQTSSWDHAFGKFAGEARDHFCPTRSFMNLPVVLAPAPDTDMELVLITADLVPVDGIFFVHHTPGCDWQKVLHNYKFGREIATASAVSASHRWLHFHQDKDGKWNSDDFRKNCYPKENKPCDGKGHLDYDIAVTSLALLTFLNGIEANPDSTAFRKTINRALDWLLTQQDKNGLFVEKWSHWKLYNHILATWTLCRACEVLDSEKYREPAAKAVQVLLKARNPDSGWGNNPRDGKSNSMATVSATMALVCARRAKIEVPGSAFKNALSFLDGVTNAEGVTGYEKKWDDLPDFKYRKYTRLPVATAAATACRLLCGVPMSNSDVQQGVQILMKNLPEYDKPEHEKVDFMYWYFGTLALRQVGGDNWKKWCAALKKALLNSWRVGGCADGSWDPVGRWGEYLGRVGVTVLGKLTLDVYYSYARVHPEFYKKRMSRDSWMGK